MKTQRLPVDLDVFQCLDCGKLTTRQEITQRVFRTGLCGYCGGQVEPKENLDQADEQEMASAKRIRKLRGGRSKRSIRR
jgi:hypothetical protein